jgi:hypothetical protein
MSTKIDNLQILRQFYHKLQMMIVTITMMVMILIQCLVLDTLVRVVKIPVVETLVGLWYATRTNDADNAILKRNFRFLRGKSKPEFDGDCNGQIRIFGFFSKVLETLEL